MISTPLRYNISSWDQLVNCLSNYSNKLHIRIKKIIQYRIVQGTLIEVYHDDVGVLFCYLVDGHGPLLASSNPLVYELNTADLLKELERFGYFITFDVRASLSEDQKEYLRTVKKLGFDKLRLLYVYHHTSSGTKESDPHVVVFNIAPNPGWMDNTYSASKEEFVSALSAGTAVDLTSMSECKRFHWDWLSFVANIDDVLNE